MGVGVGVGVGVKFLTSNGLLRFVYSHLPSHNIRSTVDVSVWLKMDTLARSSQEQAGKEQPASSSQEQPEASQEREKS